MNMLQRLLIATLLITGIGMVYSQYKGPGNEQKIYTVKEIKDNAVKLDRQDIIVAVRGKIIQQLNHNTYLFKDATGSIHAEIKKKNMPSFPFDEKTTVILRGEVDYDLLEGTELEVDEVIINQ